MLCLFFCLPVFVCGLNLGILVGVGWGVQDTYKWGFPWTLEAVLACSVCLFVCLCKTGDVGGDCGWGVGGSEYL